MCKNHEDINTMRKSNIEIKKKIYFVCKFFSFTLYFLAISRDLNILLHVLQKVGEIICGNGNIGV